MRDRKEVSERSQRQDVCVEEDDLGEGSESEDVEFGEDRSEIRSTCERRRREEGRSAHGNCGRVGEGGGRS